MMRFCTRTLAVVAVSLGIAVQAGAAVKICRTGGADVLVDNTGAAPVSAAFQKCIDDNAITAINLPPGTYLVDTPIFVRRANLKIATAGLAGNNKNCQQLGDAACARFLASSVANACINNPGECHTTLTASGGGLLQARNTKQVIFDHLILDGNRAQRGQTEAKNKCLEPGGDGGNRFGFNGQMVGCEGANQGERCEFTYNFTRNALCGTGLLWAGDFGRIQGNAAYNNGVHSVGLWADGITVNRNNKGIVNDNHLVNNTDVALIFGAAAGTQIQSNWIEQNGVYAFAALMLGNFAEASVDPNAPHPSGDYTGATVRSNTIDCNAFWCGFGLNFGPDPWTADNRDNVFGGTVTQNKISGGRVLINFGGAGKSSATAPNVTGNTLSGAPTTDMPIADGSTCIAAANVKANLIKNQIAGADCGNWVNTDASPQSAKCFHRCF